MAWERVRCGSESAGLCRGTGAYRATALRPVTRAGPELPSSSSPREYDPRGDYRAGAGQHRPGYADRRVGLAQADRRRLPGALSLPRRDQPELYRYPQEGPLLL